MSTLGKATAVIHTWQKRHPTLMDKDPEWSAQNLAGDLNREDLLAPKLPEPDHDTRDPQWRAEYKENYGYEAPDVWCLNPWSSVGVFPKSHDVTIWDDGEPLEPFSIEEARKFAYNLLAAANMAEANKAKAETNQ